MEYKIKIEDLNFEGPFDLLLHLLKNKEMDIYDIKICDITNQYMGYIRKMQEMDLEVTSEFIIVAATLLEIKSRMLLPKPKNETEEESPEESTRKLVEKLAEYKKFKAAAEFLRDKMLYAGTVFSKKPEVIDDLSIDKRKDENYLAGVTMLQLYNIYNEVLERYNNKKNQNNTLKSEIPMDMFKIEDKMREIATKVEMGKKYTFKQIVEGCNGKMEIIVTFLALLELIKMKDIKVFQEESFHEIFVERIGQNGEITSYSDRD
ncbi:segregation/condensation protein A [Clostridium oryzae]|uniref:Segregation and condensation protein A n=1 Tax=Clostridium oryzae TaxID=1450648 RepID=A0A1V4ITD7_9CLOT|nr:segregation/condensation protein A [Clostridium oryzae]OPJ63186.1 segregation and condensation protein A [Clostridium oryzae]